MAKVTTKLIFEFDPEFTEIYEGEAKKLNITKIELFRRMWELWLKQKKLPVA